MFAFVHVQDPFIRKFPGLLDGDEVVFVLGEEVHPHSDRPVTVPVLHDSHLAMEWVPLMVRLVAEDLVPHEVLGGADTHRGNITSEVGVRESV